MKPMHNNNKYYFPFHFNPFNTSFTKWSNRLKQFVGNLPTNCLGMFDHFVELALKGLRNGINTIA